MEKIGKIIRRLEKIAKFNGDEFKYRVDIEPSRLNTVYTFVAEEATDHHMFVSGYGITIDKAVDDAAADMGDACANWGYDEPEE